METKHKSEVELAADELVDKFISIHTDNPKYKIKYLNVSLMNAVKAQRMVVDSYEKVKMKLSQMDGLFYQMTQKEYEFEQAILTELKSRL